ncbi:PREDICTED: uncharacterized protein LOC104801095 isoform X2 [Tarenaya hassleriana]|nr:PREDICTED: uncharacterized protein LOC104801095 isoform X2 [Tarenaya hassleriana]
MEARVNQDSWPSNEMDRPSSGTGGCMEDMNTVVSLPDQQIVEKEDMLECKMENKDEVDSKQEVTDNPMAIGGKTETLVSETLRVGDALNRDRGIMSRIASREEEAGRDKLKSGDCLNVCNIEIIESTAENDLPTLAGPLDKTLQRDECCQDKGVQLPDGTDAGKATLLRRPLTESGSRKYQAKGKGKEKEKALSDVNIDGRTQKDIDDDGDDDAESFGSVESCNSAGLVTRGKRRANFEGQMIVGSKRLKMQIQECQGSTSKLRQDSSFMNWISNMMKGFWKANEEKEEDHSPAGALTVTETDDHVNRNDDQQHYTGFQSFFQSIYCPRRNIQDACVNLLDEECDTDAAPLSCRGKLLPNFQEQVLVTNGNHVSVSSENKNSCNHESYSDKDRKSSPPSGNKSKPNRDKTSDPEPDGKEIQTFANRNSALRSLWISRFSSRNSCLQSNGHHDGISSINIRVQEANESVSVMVKTRDSQEITKEDCARGYGNSNLMQNNLNLVVASPRIESSEALASLFARRLGVIKHIVPLDLAGKVEGSVVTLTCFYCGKKGHHLRDCSEVTDNELRDLLIRNINAQNGREKASGVCIRCFQLNHWAATCPNAPWRNSRAEGNKSRHLEGTIAGMMASTSGPKFSVQDSGDNQAIDVPEAVFDAVRVLRLSRTDILKWMNSKVSGSDLEGFFLRLRLGKWEEGLGGTGYYVACITGTVEEQSSARRSENSISVKVGRTTCLVESQYISNHDFLEEELTAWWRATAKNGGSVPSEEELRRKIRQRKMLGF